MTKDIRLIATDMDGTLLNDGREISPENIKAIHAAIEQGIEVAVATGRDYTEAVMPLKEADLRLPLVCVNGAEVRERDGEIIHQQILTYEDFVAMQAILEEEKLYYEVYTTKGAYSNNAKRGLDVIVDLLVNTGKFGSYDEVMSLAEERFAEGAINMTDDYNALLQQEGVELFKILAFTEDDEKRNRAKHQLTRKMDVAVSSSAKENLEITHISATKGEGIRQLSRHFNIPVENMMVIGDNFNDVSMMKTAGYSVAMGNAEEEVKQICDEVTDENVNAGVAKAINRILGVKK
ncbi:Cof-type HAD-IIB family hydrolase [Evansella clarkii]|uniref:Cof-type HAD-IIB family hydrolase n=1 Tax=Evansella clarkii TaxID=79879 RepID=UPI001FD4198A|nr:Cof-type HAD-IIB family hydrolase [Evansella clarkii]